MNDHKYAGVQPGVRRPTDDEYQEIAETTLYFEEGKPQTGRVHIDDYRKASVIDITADGTYEAADGVFDFRVTIGPSAGLDFWGEEGDLPVHVEPEPEPRRVLVPKEWTHMSWWLCRNAFKEETERILKLYHDTGHYDDFFQPGGFRAAKARKEAEALADTLEARIGTVADWERAAKMGYDGSGTLSDARRKDEVDSHARQLVAHLEAVGGMPSATD